ncbi:CoA transferase [Variovorax sp. PCZ-1]|uniref:CoA transferase n=1 Tax=Variovorax sp. PCZ-1 TaxID=2835533 RepID=UPI001BD027C0|nr:CoA transferase [Variovorax sp. PCZ-1]MBS7807498.1 CoA transferase [Variovorax sp. PCZ-1]
MATTKPLRGTRILSLALNLPGPAALMRLKAFGASCTKLESPAGDPMNAYSKPAYKQMHEGVKIVTADLKTEKGMVKLHKLLEKTDILLTSFRPSALARLGLSWKQLHKAHPHLSQVSIVGDTAAPEIPGHDLTYMAEHDLIQGLHLPPTLFADMGGSLLAVEAVLAAVIQQRTTGRSSHQSVGLSQAAQYLALPRHWKLTTPDGLIGGAHAFYQVMPCKDGRVVIAALESHFAERLAKLVGAPLSRSPDVLEVKQTKHTAAFMFQHTCKELAVLSEKNDLPLYVIPNK